MDPTADFSTLFRRAKDLLKSGRGMPVEKIANSNTELYKLVPHGSNVGPYSPFFTNKAELELLQRFPELIPNRLGLPLPAESHTLVYDVYKVTPNPGQAATFFESTVASTTQGSLRQNGGAIQTLIVNRKLWTDPVLFGKINLLH